ncbi:hypothetical protein FLP10_16115 [Agromyces intestinalis]|uniref:Sporulation protein n=1 Tax=Agromyces intestinalis TaxID=2592652 RepID=A0A5C1YHU2_9MICO|nr:hypothetical protein [Agromyces intestinalis]QEO15776.1 hypothetical protein FLP10_16115 [Agromyces intestinalis]
MTELVLDLADKVAGVGVRTSYGDPVDVGGSTIVPVALGYYGFGGGSGSGEGDVGEDRQGHGEGSGGGGGGVSIPLGAYVGRGGEVRFEPNVIGLLLVATPFVWALGKTLRWIIRALKH